MRIGIVLGLITLVVLPVQAAYLVELTTGEKLTVQSYWRDGDDVHLMRGGVDIIVKSSRIKSLEGGVAEPRLKAESATASGGATTASTMRRTRSVASYRRKLEKMDGAELAAEKERVTEALAEAEASRFDAQHEKAGEDVVGARQKDIERATAQRDAIEKQIELVSETSD